MSRKQALLRYARFCSFGQYRAERSVKNYVMTQIIGALVWAGIAGAIIFYVNKGAIPAASVFVVLICAKNLISLAEPEAEKGYDLAEFLPVSMPELLKMRLFIKLLTPDEYFFHIALFFLCIRGYGPGAGIVIALAAAVCCMALTEILAFAGKKTSGSRLWKNFASASLIFLLLSCLPGLIDYYIGIGEDAAAVIRMAAALCFLAFAAAAVISRIKNPCGTKAEAAGEHDINIKASVPKQIGTLMKKDMNYLIRQKPDILYTSFAYMVVLFFVGDLETFEIFLPMYFQLELGLEFGFNCFGHDNESFVLMMLSPVSRRTIVRAKSLFFLLLNLAYIAAAYIAGLCLGIVVLSSTLYFLGRAFFALGIVLFLSVPFSIKFYYRVNGKKNYAPKFIFLSIGLFLAFIIIEVILEVVLEEQGLSTMPITVLGFAVLLAAVYFTCISGRFAAKRLEKKERVLLDKFLNSTEIKKSKSGFYGSGGGFGNQNSGFGTGSSVFGTQKNSFGISNNTGFGNRKRK